MEPNSSGLPVSGFGSIQDQLLSHQPPHISMHIAYIIGQQQQQTFNIYLKNNN